MNTLTCLEILRPATTMTKILGTYPFTYKNGRLVYSKTRLIQIFLCLATCILCTVFYFTEHHQEHPNVPKLVTFILMLRSFGWISSLLLVVVLALSKFSGLGDVARRITRIDSVLNSLGQKERIDQLGVHHRKILIVLLVFEQLVLNILFDLHSAWLGNYRLTTFIGAFVYPRVACTTMYAVFISFTIIIQKRFEIINELLHGCIKKSFCKSSISQLIHLHKMLYEASKDLNSVFSFQLLMWFGTCFLLILWDVHSATHTLLLEQTRWIVVVTFLIIFLICSTCLKDVWIFAMR
jgi:hypothetical protein